MSADPFAGYGEERSRRPVRAPPAAPRGLTGAEKAVAEDSYLFRRYRIATKAAQQEAFEAEPRLVALASDLRRVSAGGLNAADDLIGLIRQTAANWLATAPLDHRYIALRLISDRIVAIRLKADLPPFDDGFPAAGDAAEISVFHICKRELKL